MTHVTAVKTGKCSLSGNPGGKKTQFNENSIISVTLSNTLDFTNAK